MKCEIGHLGSRFGEVAERSTESTCQADQVRSVELAHPNFLTAIQHIEAHATRPCHLNYDEAIKIPVRGLRSSQYLRRAITSSHLGQSAASDTATRAQETGGIQGAGLGISWDMLFWSLTTSLGLAA